MNWAIERSQHGASELLVLLMIASCANQDGSDAWPSFVKLAKDARMSERQVKRIIKTLEASGELSVKHSTGRYPNHYSLPLVKANSDKMAQLNHDISGKTNSDISGRNSDISRTNSDIAMAHDPSVEPSVEPSLPASGVVMADPDPKTTLARGRRRAKKLEPAEKPKHVPLPEGFRPVDKPVIAMLKEMGLAVPRIRITWVVDQWLEDRREKKGNLVFPDAQADCERFIRSWAEHHWLEMYKPQPNPYPFATAPDGEASHWVPDEFSNMFEEDQEQFLRDYAEILRPKTTAV